MFKVLPWPPNSQDLWDVLDRQTQFMELPRYSLLNKKTIDARPTQYADDLSVVS